MKIKGIGRIFITFIILLAMLIGIKKILQKKHAPISKVISRFITTDKNASTVPISTSHLESNILEKLNELEVNSDEIKTHFFLEDKRREIKAKVPKGRPYEWIIWQLSQSTKGTSYKVKDCSFNKKKKTYTISFTSSNAKKEKVILTLSETNRYLSNSAKIAILIENFDFEANKTTVDFLSFPEPLTISLIPSSKKSGWTAQAADEYNKEIIIQLPFESHIKTKAALASLTIMIHYPEEKIRKIINNAIKKIPNFSGFSNLHGSIALEDSRVMKIVLNEIKKHHGYFINTCKDKHPVVTAIAKKIHLPYEEVTAVIKEESDITVIEEQLKHYAVIAQKKSKILIAAKASRLFIKALNNVLPTLQQNGIQLVYVSEIVSHTKGK